MSDTATDWYISRAHAVRALGYLGAEIAERGYLPEGFEQPLLLEIYEQGLNATVEDDDRSPVDERHLSDSLAEGEES